MNGVAIGNLGAKINKSSIVFGIDSQLLIFELGTGLVTTELKFLSSA